jgi:hypothetical protein
MCSATNDLSPVDLHITGTRASVNVSQSIDEDEDALNSDASAASSTTVFEYYDTDEYRSSQDRGSDLSSLVPDSSGTWNSDEDATYDPPSSSMFSSVSSISSSRATTISSAASMLPITISSVSSRRSSIASSSSSSRRGRFKHNGAQKPRKCSERDIEPFASPSPEVIVNILSDNDSQYERVEAEQQPKRPRLTPHATNDSALGM